jgi:anaerobic magnesium-protoporphyrin IX monomethyl ester cyclase
MKFKHPLFLNPYLHYSSTSAMKLFPPTGLEYVATNAGVVAEKVTLLDLRYEEELSQIENLNNFIRDENIDIICVGIGWDRQLDEIYQLLNQLPQDIPLVVGGYTATERVEEIFNRCPRVRLIVRGEGEETIKEIIQNKPYADILGISFRKNGEIIHNQQRPLPALDGLLYPDRFLRNNTYCLSISDINMPNWTFDTVLSARGCPYKCKFCTFTLNPLGQKREYSARGVESVVEEIASISAKVVLFSDENFSVDPKRAEKICDLIIERGIKKRFAVQTRIEIAKHPRLLDKMVKAGFKTLLIGIESPHDHILKQLDKGFDSQTIIKYFEVLKNYPLYYHGYFIYGNIGETKDEMLYIAEFAKKIGLDSITFLKLRIEKFSLLKEVVEKTPGYHIASNDCVYSDEISYDNLKKIGRQIKFSFYTPGRYLRILKKCFAIKFFLFRDIAMLMLILPRVLAGVIRREIQRGRLKDSLRRTFVSNRT